MFQIERRLVFSLSVLTSSVPKLFSSARSKLQRIAGAHSSKQLQLSEDNKIKGDFLEPKGTLTLILLAIHSNTGPNDRENLS